jgi:hypothetical protein
MFRDVRLGKRWRFYCDRYYFDNRASAQFWLGTARPGLQIGRVPNVAAAIFIGTGRRGICIGLWKRSVAL